MDAERDRQLMPPPLPARMARSIASPSDNSESPIAMRQASSDISDSLKSEPFSGSICWACSSQGTHIAHVVAEKDPQVYTTTCSTLNIIWLTVFYPVQIQLWQELGLINFSLTSTMNAIELCPTCHLQFDLAGDPGFSFIPTDLQYFIQFELKDRDRRRTAVEKGEISKRQVPTAEMYRAHQLMEGKISNNAIGGQYTPVFLKRYLLTNLPFDISSQLSFPKEWHGSPIAAIRRAIPILGSARLKAIGKKTRLELEQLRNMHFLDDDDTEPLTISNNQPTRATTRRGEKRYPEEDQGSPKKRVKDSAGPDNTQGTMSWGGQDLGTKQCPLQLKWEFGPDFSAEEVVRLYAPMYAHG
jgi:hypothetical protein